MRIQNYKNKYLKPFFCNKIDSFPNEIKLKIFSYLYFSDEISNKITAVNHLIKEYNIFHLNYLCNIYDLLIVNYFVLKYYLYDKFNSERLLIDYDILSKDKMIQENELRRIFRILQPIDILRLCKYIKFRMKDSSFYAL